jgi:hypothetical protein
MTILKVIYDDRNGRVISIIKLLDVMGELKNIDTLEFANY